MQVYDRHSHFIEQGLQEIELKRWDSSDFV